MNISDNSGTSHMSLEDSVKSLSLSAENSSSSKLEASSLSQFDDIVKILKESKPDLSPFWPRFIDAFIINSSIEHLTEASVSEIFKKEIRLRPIFMKSLHQFRNPEEKEEEILLKSPKCYKLFAAWKPCVSIYKLQVMASLQSDGWYSAIFWKFVLIDTHIHTYIWWSHDHCKGIKLFWFPPFWDDVHPTNTPPTFIY